MDKNDRKAALAAYKQRKITGGVFQIVNIKTGRRLLMSDADLKGSENRFRFSQMTGSCTYGRLTADWLRFGAEAFRFETLEEMEKKEDQTDEAFREDLALLEEIWRERNRGETLY